MNANRRDEIRRGFTVLELLVLVMMLGFLTSASVSRYLSETRQAGRTAANDGAQALATVIKEKVDRGERISEDAASYSADLGYVLNENPCAQSQKGYNIIKATDAVVVSAQEGSHCGGWSPNVFRISLRKGREKGAQ